LALGGGNFRVVGNNRLADFIQKAYRALAVNGINGKRDNIAAGDIGGFNRQSGAIGIDILVDFILDLSDRLNRTATDRTDLDRHLGAIDLGHGKAGAKTITRRQS